MNRTFRKEFKSELIGLTIITLALLGLASLFSPSVGTAGRLFNQGLLIIAGEGRYLLPLVIFFIGLKIIRLHPDTRFTSQFYGLFLMLLLILTFLHLSIPLAETFTAGKQGEGGGLLGATSSYLLLRYFGLIGSYIILTSLMILSLVLLTNLSLTQLGEGFGMRLSLAGQKIMNGISNFIFEEIKEEQVADKKVIINNHNQRTGTENIQSKGSHPEKKQEGLKKRESNVIPFSVGGSIYYQLPPTTMLSPVKIKDNGVTEKEINDKINTLEETLASFSINIRVTQVTVGPVVTRYEIQPPAGVKISRIVGLADDLALAMAVPQVRIEAPIPGRAAIGIEAPNRKISTVHLRELLESKEFQKSASRLTVALGKDIAGTSIVADLAQMPHLLVAGATGSGKSVCINSIVASILFKALPEEVKFILIDPKMVELITYNGIPHLITPVVTNPKKAAGILYWAVKEMERRYELFAAAGVKDITRYNELSNGHNKDAAAEITGKIKEARFNDGPLPFILIIIDELADLMMIAPAEVEDSICRLAQMARAAGLHLVVATQRPSVDIITGLIKANIPSRISFAVSSQMDSRTILDIGGAEKLLGRGDMLFFPVGASKPVRIQGAFLSDQEVETVVNFLKIQGKPEYDQEVTAIETPENNNSLGEEGDELLPQAVQLFMEKGNASISLLQRRFHIGYARAARLVDIMEQKGIIGKFEGSKPRPILMTLEQFKKAFHNKEAG